MGIKQQKIGVSELTIGMFVSGLDRPWAQTPFPLQGFYVRDLDEIKELKIHCDHVYIDVRKGSVPPQITLRRLESKENLSDKSSRRRLPAKVPELSPLKVRHNFYKVSKPIEKEIAAAKLLHNQVSDAIDKMVSQVIQGDDVSAIKDTRVAAGQMVDSVLRSPDAFTWLSRVKNKDQHTYSHSVRSAVWAILFGRHIGLPKTDLDALALGVLLKDIGKARLTKSLLESSTLSSCDEEKYQKFVEYGVEILRNISDMSLRVVSVVKHHCERIDGSGFPSQLQGNKIPLLGRIAGLVSFYDEILNKRGQEKPLSPSKAVAKLYALRGNKFQEDLVLEFIRAIGLYPTGTIVELSSGEVAVVVEQNFERRLKPVVFVVTDTEHSQLDAPYLLDLAAEEKALQASSVGAKKRPSGSSSELVSIVKDVQLGVYDINVSDVLDEYIHQRQATGLFGLLKFKKFSIV